MTKARSELARACGLLAAVLFAFGCQDAPPDIAGPAAPGPELHHRDGHTGGPDGGGDDDGDGSADVLAGATLAISTTEDHLMTAVSDNAKSLSMNSDDSSRGTVSWSFTTTYAQGFESCATEGPESTPWLDLFALLDGGSVDDGAIAMSYGKRADGSASSDHEVMSNGTIEGERVLIGLPAHGDPAPTATAGTDADGNETYTYSDGVVRIWLKSGKKKDHQKVFCPNAGDEVTITVKR